VARGESGRLRIGFISTADYSILPALLNAFARRYPGVDVDLLELTGDEQLRCLHEGSIDVGILIPAQEDPTLEWMRMYREPLVGVVPRSHRLARRSGALPVKELRSEPFVLFPRALAPTLYDMVISYAEAAGFSPTIGQEARQMQTIIGLVAGGLGVAIVPACMENLRRRDVVYKKLAPKPPQVITMLAWRASRPSEVVQAFVGVGRQFRTKPRT
jgi:DNA-binding transcriptional LysR family regulator